MSRNALATVCAFDSTTIDWCLSVFAWTPFRSTKAGIKLNTLLNLRGSIPSFIHITVGGTHDAHALDRLSLEAGAFYPLDRVNASVPSDQTGMLTMLRRTYDAIASPGLVAGPSDLVRAKAPRRRTVGQTAIMPGVHPSTVG